MSVYETPTLPGTPKPALRAVLEALNPAEAQALLPHLLGDTGAGWVAETLTRHGHRISKTSILEFRRSIRQTGKC